MGRENSSAFPQGLVPAPHCGSSVSVSTHMYQQYATYQEGNAHSNLNFLFSSNNSKIKCNSLDFKYLANIGEIMNYNVIFGKEKFGRIKISVLTF